MAERPERIPQCVPYCQSGACYRTILRVLLVLAGPQNSAKDFPGGRPGNLLDEYDLPRPFKIRKIGLDLAVLVDVSGRETALCRDDEGRHHLSPFWILGADYRRFHDIRMPGEHVFHLGRIDVLPAGDNHVVDAPRNENISVRILIAHVAREVPSFPERLLVSVGPPPIPAEGFLAPEGGNDLTDLATGDNFIR